MDILKASTDWAKAEVFSSSFFILFGVLFIVGTIGFWQLGKTEMAKAYVVPTLVCGLLLLTIGIGIFYANKMRVTSFAEAYEADAAAFVQSEIARTQQSLNEYKTIVFKVIPGIVIAAVLLLVFVDKSNWRAICISTIAMMVVIFLVDSNADARLKAYKAKLDEVANDN